MNPPEIRLHLHDKQRKALDCPAQEIVFGGAAGGGKSYLMRAAAITFCAAIPGLQVYLFRRTRGDIILNHFSGAMNFHEMLAPWTASGHARITLSANKIRFWNGATIHLCFLEKPKDRNRYQGAEIHMLEVDELTHFTDEEYRWLRSRMRLGGLLIPPELKLKFPRALNGTNPGGIGHNWVKEGFVENGEMVIRDMPDEDGGFTRCFIPSRTSDNPTLDPNYEKTLAGLGDPLLVRAMMDGDWEIVAGAMFGSTWRRHLHVCEPFPIPVDWKIWRGADDGFAAPHAAVWITKDPTTGTHYIVDELYRKGMLPDEVARRTKTIDHHIPRHVLEGREWKIRPNATDLSGILDSAAFAKTGSQTAQLQNAIPRGTTFNQLGLRYTPCIKWPECRAAYAKHFHKLLAPNPKTPIPGKPGEFFPLLRVFSHCTEFIKRVPNLPRDPKDPEVIDDSSEDHIFDAASYGLMWKENAFQRGTRTGL